MGGARFPLELTRETFSAIGHLLPTAWATDRFQNIIVRGLDFNSVELPAGLLLACTLAFSGWISGGASLNAWQASRQRQNTRHTRVFFFVPYAPMAVPRCLQPRQC
jgi:hypothetical protein